MKKQPYIRPLNRTIEHVADLVQRLQQVPNFLKEDNPYDALVDSSNTVFEVGEAGLVLFRQVPDYPAAEVHITFWDGRLRGREDLCRWLGLMYLEATKIEQLGAAIPLGSKVVLAFAKRVGFKEVQTLEDKVFLVATKGDLQWDLK